MEVRHIDGPNDVRGILSVNSRAWRKAYNGLLPDDVLEAQPVEPTTEDVRQQQGPLEENREGILVAVDEGRVRGFVDLRWGDTGTKEFVDDGEADLRAIYVDPEYWGQGIGTTLLERGLDLLPSSVERVRLEVFTENEPARRFYEAKGFERTATGEYEIAGRTYPTTIYTVDL